MNLKPNSRVVGRQFGGWFNMTLSQFATIVGAALRDEAWDMSPYGRKQRPRHLVGAYRAVDRDGNRFTEHFEKGETTYIEQPIDWIVEDWEEAAWALHDVDPALLPLCPWCGFEAGLSRGAPVPVRQVGAVADLPLYDCPVCKKHFVEQDGRLDEVEEAV